jgi:hypothetical protein
MSKDALESYMGTYRSLLQIKYTTSESIALIKNRKSALFIEKVHPCIENIENSKKFNKCVYKSVCPEELENLTECSKRESDISNSCAAEYFQFEDCIKGSITNFLGVLEKARTNL